jgi:hypothetical protein
MKPFFWKLRGRLAPHVVCLLLSVHLVWHGILWDSMIFWSKGGD